MHSAGWKYMYTRMIILCLRPITLRDGVDQYIVTPSLIGWARAQKDPYIRNKTFSLFGNYVSLYMCYIFY